MLRKILVPTDFSEASTAALDCACGLARSTNAELVVLHVADHLQRDARAAVRSGNAGGRTLRRRPGARRHEHARVDGHALHAVHTQIGLQV